MWNSYVVLFNSASLVAQMVTNMPAMQETQVQSLDWEDPLEKWMATHSVFLPGEFHRQRSLAGLQSTWISEECLPMNITFLKTHIYILFNILFPL